VKSHAASAIPYVDGKTGVRVDPLRRASIEASSKGLPWNALVAEIVAHSNWESNDVTVGGHYLAMNIGAVPLRFEAKGPHGFQHVLMPPGSIWLNPEGRPFTHRVTGAMEFGAIVLPATHVNRLLGRHVELRPRCGFEDEVLRCLCRAVLLEMRDGGKKGPPFADALALAISVHLATHHATRQVGVAAESGHVSPERFTRVFEYVEEHLGGILDLEKLASVAGLSASHFGREFKRIVGQTPLAYMMGRRLERARSAIRGSADDCGCGVPTRVCRPTAPYAPVQATLRRHARDLPSARSRSASGSIQRVTQVPFKTPTGARHRLHG